MLLSEQVQTRRRCVKDREQPLAVHGADTCHRLQINPRAVRGADFACAVSWPHGQSN